MFQKLDPLAPDALLALIKLYAADDRASKIDLGVGVYRTADGDTPVFRAVKAAEKKLLETQDSKAYLGPEGDMGFVNGLMPYIFGQAVAADRLCGVQTPGGTGALRMAAELMKRLGISKVLLGTPSWPNHAPIMKTAGLEVVTYSHCDIDTQTLTFDALLAAMEAASENDAVLLHGCCHNPTGIDFSLEQWSELTAVILRKNLFPLVDIAYQGLGHGFDEDAAGMRHLLSQVPEALIAYSCDKNFGVYRDRVGALYGLAEQKSHSDVLAGHFANLARANWSMPPDHGAAAVRVVLEDPALTQMWLDEVADMRARLRQVRDAIAARSNENVGAVDLAAVGSQSGLFSTLKLSPDQVKQLREEHAVYMAGSGRVNIAGFTLPQVDQFVEALKAIA